MQHQHDYAVVEKRIGETPLATLARLRSERAIPEGVPLAYAGRLDPLAYGKLLVLIGDTCKDATRYRALDKEYLLTVLCGVTSDTGDTLGIPHALGTPKLSHTDQEIARVLTTLHGVHTVPYPAFSSKTVAGTPLWRHALDGTLDTIQVPSTTSTLYRISLEGSTVLSTAHLAARIEQQLDTVAPAPKYAAHGADFRVPEIRNAWRTLLKTTPRSHTTLTLRVTCSSGTYMRTLADTVARSLGTRGLALSIERTEIGRYLPFPLLSGRGIWRTRL